MPATVEQPKIEDPQLTRYLTWLDDSKDIAPPKPPPGLVPTILPGMSSKALGQEKGTLSSKSHKKLDSDRHSKKKHKHKPKKHEESIDVELVDVKSSPAIQLPQPAGKNLGVSRRDLLLVGIGAGGALAALAVAGIVASGGPAGILKKLGVTRDEGDPPKPEATQ